MDLISVIIPVYNTEAYLDDCLGSILNSTYHNLEIICVDDCSDDQSYDILKKYAQTDNRVAIYRMDQNVGQAKARNFALDHSHGIYYAFVDSDDMIRPEMIETMYEALKHNKTDIAVCGYHLVDESGHEKNRQGSCPDNIGIMTEKEWWSRYSQGDLFILNAMWNKLYRNNCFEGIRFENGVIFEDVAIQHRLFHNKTITCISETLYDYRVRDNSTLTKKISIHNFYRIDAMLNRAEYFLENEWIDECLICVCDAVRSLGKFCGNREAGFSEEKVVLTQYSKKIKHFLKIYGLSLQKNRLWKGTAKDQLKIYLILYTPSLYLLLKCIKGVF